MVPRFVDVEFTARCNLSCGFCFGPSLDKCGPDLPTAFWLSALRWIREAGAQGIVASGGEPTLRKDITVLLAHARQLGLSVVLSTNGRNRRTLLRCAQHADWISLPVDGVTRKTLAAMRGTPWGLHEAASRIADARAVNPGLRIKLGTVATCRNAGELLDLARQIRDTHVRIDTWKIYQYTPRRRFVGRESEYTISDLDFRSLCGRIARELGNPEFEVVFSSRHSRRRAYLLVCPDGALATPEVENSTEEVVYGNLYREGPSALQKVGSVDARNHSENYLSTYPDNPNKDAHVS